MYELRAWVIFHNGWGSWGKSTWLKKLEGRMCPAAGKKYGGCWSRGKRQTVGLDCLKGCIGLNTWRFAIYCGAGHWRVFCGLAEKCLKISTLISYCILSYDIYIYTHSPVISPLEMAYFWQTYQFLEGWTERNTNPIILHGQCSFESSWKFKNCPFLFIVISCVCVIKFVCQN